MAGQGLRQGRARGEGKGLVHGDEWAGTEGEEGGAGGGGEE